MTRRSDLRTFLRTLDPETLADLLCEQAERDPDLRRRLHALACGAEHGGLAEVSDLLDDAVRAAESVQIASVLDTLQRLLDSGTSADVAPLARRAVDKIVTALGDTDNAPGGMADQLSRAVRLYARACAAHPPPASELAEWITRIAFDRPGWPEIALPDFAEALRDEGTERVRSVVDTVLAEEPADGVRARTARRLKQEVAEITGDVDTVVRLLSEQLPRLDVSLKIVRVLRAAGRHTEAIAHAAKALGNEHSGRRGGVIDALERARAQQSATEVGARSPAEATAETVTQPAVEGEAEGGVIPDAATEPAPKQDSVPTLAGNHGDDESADPARVDALLWQDRDEQAWKAAARHQPTELVPVYRGHIERLIEQRSAQHYARAATQLRRLRTLYRRAGTTGEFNTYLAELVEVHRRKTRLLDEIRKARIALPRAARP